MSLAKAEIKAIEGQHKDQPITVMFNPEKIIYTKASNWSAHPAHGQPLPPTTFASVTPATLDVTLIFDGTEEGGNDVAHAIDKLAELTQVDSSLDNGTAPGGGGNAASQSKQNRPPKVQFAWGSYLSFKGAITRLTSTISLFLDDGTPIRASVQVMIQQVEDEAVFPKQNPTSGGRTGERIHRLAPRETLDQVAYWAFGQTGLWRALAAFNGIDDPLRLQAGDAILLPASVDDLKALG